MSRRIDTPAAYEDVKYVLDIAVKRPGLIYELDTHGEATHFKQRCNQYRVLLRKIAEEQAGLTPGFRPEIIYDTLTISQIDQDGVPDRTGRRLLFKHPSPIGRLIDPDTGEDISLDIGHTIIESSS